MKYRTDLSLAQARELLAYDRISGVLTWITNRKGQPKPGNAAGTLNEDGYIKIRVDGIIYQAHRIAWLLETGAWPEAEIDHRNLQKSDNHWENLRPATHGQNMINVAGRRAGLKGAYRRKSGSWYSNIRANNKQIRVGEFATEAAAHAAYCEAARKHHGEFARAS